MSERPTDRAQAYGASLRKAYPLHLAPSDIELLEEIDRKARRK